MVSAALGPSITNLFKIFGPTAGATGVGAGLGLGAGAGGAASQVALLPFNAANNFIGSAYFGYGMIIGERYAYQADWPKIQARLEAGEEITSIMHEYAGVFTAMVMKEAQIVFESLQEGLAQMMAAVLDGQATLGSENTTTSPPSTETFVDPSLVPEGEVVLNPDGSISTQIPDEEFPIDQEEQEAIALRNDLQKQETQYLVKLSSVTDLASYWNNYLPAQDDGGTTIIDFLRLWNMATATQPRTRSSSSDQLLDVYRGRLLAARQQLINASTDPSFDALVVQQQINLLHELIWMHQLVYSR